MSGQTATGRYGRKFSDVEEMEETIDAFKQSSIYIPTEEGKFSQRLYRKVGKMMRGLGRAALTTINFGYRSIIFMGKCIMTIPAVLTVAMSVVVTAAAMAVQILVGAVVVAVRLVSNLIGWIGSILATFVHGVALMFGATAAYVMLLTLPVWRDQQEVVIS